MAKVIVTIKIMPESPDTNLKLLEEKAKKVISEFGAEFGKTDIEPIAFGLKAVKIMFIMDEDKGSPDALEQEVRELDGVNSAEISDVRRTIG